MSLQIPTAPHIPDVPQKLGPRGRIFFWISAIVSFGLLGYLILVVAHQMLVPPPAQRLIIVQDIPLPSGLANNAQQATSLAPGVELQFDGFDFQAYDAATHRLFIAHTDLHKIFAADSEDNIIYDINVNTMQIEGQIQLPANEGPDAVGYEPVDHRIFVSDTGSPIDPLKSGNVDRKNQNIAVIDAVHDKLLSLVNFGSLPLFGGEHAPLTQPGNIPTYGHAVGHNGYDLGHDYVTSQVLPNADDPNASILPPPHTAEFIAINAVTMKVDDRIVLPSYCSTPHGMTIDKEQHVAFVACTDFNPQAGFFEIDEPTLAYQEVK